MNVSPATAPSGAQTLEAHELAPSFFEQMFADLPMGAAVIDRVSERVLAVNRTHAALVGLAADEMVGRMPPYPWWAEGWRPPVVEWPAGVSRPYEGMYRHRNGMLLPVELRSFTVDAEGRRFVVLVNSESDLRRLERQLAQSGKLAAIGELAAGVAHEINNPLFAILGLVEFLLKEAEPGTKTHERLTLIDKTGHQIKEIVAALLDFAREPTDAHVQFSLTAAVREAVELLRCASAAKGVELTEEYPSDEIEVVGSPNQIKQIVVNLVRNAQQAMPEGGTVRVTVGEDAGGAVVSVADDGPGIPPDVLPRIFEPFFTTRRAGGGSGLGLAVSHGLAAMHGGEILVDSAPGDGTTFTLRLPLGQTWP